jgi:lipase chaperone LimK
MQRTAIVVAAIAVVGAVVLWVWRGDRGHDTTTAASLASAPPPVALRVEAQPIRPAIPEAAATAPRVLPASLRGTDVDGDLLLDADGHLVATAGAIRMFDYFLTTLGEVDLAAVRRMVADEAARRVPGRQDEVLALFDRYVAYLQESEAVARRAAPPDGAGDPVALARDQLGRLEELQRQRFGADDATRMFGDENALSRAILDRSDVLVREDLSPEQQRAELTAIEARLPPAMREARARMRAPAEARAEVEALRQRGASAAEIRAVRVRYFGEDAADRLEALDRP